MGGGVESSFSEKLLSSKQAYFTKCDIYIIFFWGGGLLDPCILKYKNGLKEFFIPVQNLLWGQSAAPPSGTRSDWLWKRVLKEQSLSD